MLRRRLEQLAREEEGFSLVELMVALVMGVIVIGALVTILAVSVHETAAISNNVQSDRQSRTTMTKIVNELHSACLAPDFKPVRSPSNGSELRFVNAYSNQAVIPNAATSASEGAYEHRIKFETVASKGRLVDSAYPSLSTSSWPEFKFNETTPSKTSLLGESISQTGATPIFQYYKYAKAANTGNEATALEPLGAQPETAALAALVAAVRVSFTTAPEDTKFQAPLASTRVASEKVALSSQVTFAFSAPNAETPVEASPCE